MTSTAEVSTEIMSEVASVVAASTGFADCHGSAVSIRGSRAVLSFRFDRYESARRRTAGLGAITSPDILNLLMGLPVGEPVPMEFLTQTERSVLRAVPPGAVSSAEGVVIRHAVPPLNVDLAVVPVRSWRKGLERAGFFAPFCSPVMVLRAPPPDLNNLRFEADFYGIGVIVAVRDTEPEMLVAPAKFRRNRFTAAGWRFLEEAYQQVR